MTVTKRSVHAHRRVDTGKIYVEIRVEVSGIWPATAWPVEAVFSKHPYAFIDGVRHDLTDSEIQELRKEVNRI